MAILAAGVLVKCPAVAATAQIPASKDNTPYQPASGGTTNSNGAGEHFIAGKTDDGYIRRGVIAFNVTNFIPLEIQEIQLELMEELAAQAVPSRRAGNPRRVALTFWPESSGL